MAVARALTLVIPGLLDIVRSAPGTADPSAPALARMLALSRAPQAGDQDPLAIACRALGIERQNDWPVAPWIARGARLSGPGGYWLCADPVYLALQRDEVRLRRVVSDIESGEAAALIAALNAHFAADALRFHAPQPARWLVHTELAQALATCAPEVALGEAVRNFLPRGSAAPTWRRWQSEIQMLLFEHPVNRAREKAGRDVVNGVWLWGGGAFAGPGATPSVATVYAGVAWLRELAAARGVAAFAAPVSFVEVDPSSAAMVWLDAVDARDISTRLAELDQKWAAPLHDALRRGAIAAVDLVFTGRSGMLVFAPRQPTLARRWTLALATPRLSVLLGEDIEA